jgi:hypothetical protein
MTHKEFHETIERIAGGHYATTIIFVTTERGGQRRFRYQAYIDQVGFTKESPCPEAAIKEMTVRAGDPQRAITLDSIDPLPDAAATAAYISLIPGR